jgi:hypothetical protein
MAPLHQQKYQVIFQDTIFLLLHMPCVVLGASLFLFSVLFYFVFCSILLDPIMFVLERDTLRFHCLEHSSFTLIVLRVFSFSSTAFSFYFLPLCLFITCYFFVARCV